MRIGFGYDVHKLVEGRPLILGGIEVPFEKGLLGHSDADVLLHAISDALLGAAALGDIGKHFPDTDDKWKGADSKKLLREVAILVAREGFRISNVDSTVAIQQPKLRPYIDEMRQSIATILGLYVDEVSVKATTTEMMGFVGTGEGVSAYAVCLLEAV
ncbi:MAG: 2-C-methyl-D-erythritol 2,4-cyclodiphosphate synthase [Rhodothermales bacterium]